MNEIPLPSGWIRVPASQATDDEIRDWVVAFVVTLAGLSADPKAVDAYNAIVAPDELEGHASQLQKSMDAAWSCALTVDGVLRLLLKDADPETKAKIIFLFRKYVDGRAMIDEQNAAIALGGARHMRTEINFAKGIFPRRGDPIIIDAQSGATAHTFTQVTDRDESGRFKTVEGGSLDPKGFKAIEPGERLMRSNGIITSVDGKKTHVLYCWIDIVAELRAANAMIGIPAPLAAEVAPTLVADAAPLVETASAPSSARVQSAPVWITLIASGFGGFISKHPIGVAFGVLVAAVVIYEIVRWRRPKTT